MNHITKTDDPQDEKALRRERKKRPRMRVHARQLKRLSTRGVKKIAKIEKKRRK